MGIENGKTTQENCFTISAGAGISTFCDSGFPSNTKEHIPAAEDVSRDVNDGITHNSATQEAAVGEWMNWDRAVQRNTVKVTQEMAVQMLRD